MCLCNSSQQKSWVCFCPFPLDACILLLWINRMNGWRAVSSLDPFVLVHCYYIEHAGSTLGRVGDPMDQSQVLPAQTILKQPTSSLKAGPNHKSKHCWDWTCTTVQPPHWYGRKLLSGMGEISKLISGCSFKPQSLGVALFYTALTKSPLMCVGLLSCFALHKCASGTLFFVVWVSWPGCCRNKTCWPCHTVSQPFQSNRMVYRDQRPDQVSDTAKPELGCGRSKCYRSKWCPLRCHLGDTQLNTLTWTQPSHILFHRHFHKVPAPLCPWHTLQCTKDSCVPKQCFLQRTDVTMDGTANGNVYIKPTIRKPHINLPCGIT